MRSEHLSSAGRALLPLLLAVCAGGSALGAHPGARPRPPAAPEASFYVSPRGDDRWSGRRAEPRNGDGPFATTVRARDAVRAFRKAQKTPRPVRVVLQGGTYFLDRPLELGPEDSGTKTAPVVYTAAAGQRVVLSGGSRLAGGHWGSANGQRAWVLDVPDVKAGQWRFRQLWVNDLRCPRTQLPKSGEYHIESLPDLKKNVDPGDQNVRRFVYSGDDIRRWHNLQEVEVIAPCRWRDSRLPIREVDERRRIVTFDRPSAGGLVELYASHPSTYWIENLLEALDTPGQWYLDRPAGRLYYLPRAGQQMAGAEIIAPRLQQLVRVVGTDRSPVENLHFEGITFAHSEWLPPADWAGSHQAAVDVPGALYLSHAHGCSFRSCAVEHVGGYGIEVGEGCGDIEIRGNRLTDLGGGGVKIGPRSRHTTVADNEIGDAARFFMSAVGIWVGNSPENRILHNHIHDLFYTGISVGWQWNFEPSKAVDNAIEFNHIHDVGRGMLSDMGGIYTLGRSPGTHVRGNVIHDVTERAYGGWGIYPDEGSSDIVIDRNLVYRCSSGPFFPHINHDLTVENNIFAFGKAAQIMGGYTSDRTQFTLRHNVVYYTDGEAVGGGWQPVNVEFDSNLYWNASGKAVTFGGKNLADWQAAGHDGHSMIADPLFVDPEHGDFRLRPGSPAAKIGFEAWDLSDVGPRAPGPARSRPPAPR